MLDLLQELDPDFYREARLHLAYLELQQLRRERAALADIERRAQIPLGASPPARRYDDEQSIAGQEKPGSGDGLPDRRVE